MTWWLTVTDLKQYAYCPRIPFFARCLPGVRPVTAKMEAGIQAHEDAEALERRRQLRSYGITTGERHFGLLLFSPDLRLTGRIDMAILRPDGKNIVAPVDYKLSATAGPHFKLQLACYALMLEEEMELPAPYGFLYLIPERRGERIALPASEKLKARACLAELRASIEAEVTPDGTKHAGRCANCEFRRFCNDVN